MTGSASDHVRRWWPVPVALTISLFVQKTFFESRYEVSGHAGEHLSSASVAFPAFAIVAIVLYVTPRARRQPLVLTARDVARQHRAGAGGQRPRDRGSRRRRNVRHADVTARRKPDRRLSSRSRQPGAVARRLGSAGDDGSIWGHRHVSGRVAAGAAILSAIFPPSIFPGAGVIVVTIACCLTFPPPDAN